MSTIFRQDYAAEMDLTESSSYLEVIVLQDGYQELWSKLTEFLGKDLRVQQQKLLIIQRKMMAKDLDQILKKRVDIISTMHTLWMQPNQIPNVIFVMKMKTI